jgi:hypothetical protein
MNGYIETNSDQFALSTPRTSLQNIGEKREDKEDGRVVHNFQAFGADGFTFLDFLDVINPLQHVPVVGTMYRAITGDEIDPGSRIAGSSLFGGPIGTVVALANVAIEQKTGQDIGSHMMALITDEDDKNTESKTGVNLAKSHQSSRFANSSSPIYTNVEVLEWAQRESERSAEAATEAQIKKATPQIDNITNNVEVLNWARKEAALFHPTIDTETSSLNVKNKDIRQTTLDGRKAAHSTSNALGRNQDQLSGATSPLGGWFSETMLLALTRYSESAQLGKGTIEKRSVESACSNY